MAADRRTILVGLCLLALGFNADSAFGKNGGNSGSGGGSSSGSGSGHGSGSDDSDDDDDDDHDGDQDDASNAVARGDIAPLQKILRLARSRVAGQVIDVNLRHSGADYIYRIKILSAEGRKREVHINARTLTILKVK